MGAEVMIVRLSRHVFGSDRGYRTLATGDDLTPDEIAELESFAFGQTTDQGYLESLVDTPAYWSRRLTSGRRAISRVLPGPTDEQGRQSLRFVTVLLHANDWLTALNGEDAPLLRVARIWSWSGQPQLKREEVSVAKPSQVKPTADQRQRILSLLGHIETMSDSTTSTIVVEPQDITVEELNMVVALLPLWYRPQFSYAVRSLSENLPVLVNYVAPAASRGKSRRKIVRWSPTSSLISAKYASGLAHFWPQGEPPPWEFVNNCKAFGRLMPTWDGTDSPAGTVAAPDAARKRPVRARRKLRIPGIVYWLIAILVILGATGFFVVQTVNARRHADAVLSAAEEFLATNEDPNELPASGSTRKDLIRSAESHADKVAALDVDSRADRQAAVATQLDLWLNSAGVRAQEYGSLDELLAGFDSFMKPLGLDEPGRLSQIPDAATRSAVQGWQKRLEEARSEADQIGPPYSERMNAALDRIARWETRITGLMERCESGLAVLLEKLSAEPPTELSNELLETWQQESDQLKMMASILPPLGKNENDATEPDEFHEKLVDLRARLTRIQRLADRWQDEIEQLRQAFERYASRAFSLIEKHDLVFPPVRPDGLIEAWKAAQEADAALEEALYIWPDAKDVLSQQDTVSAWMNKASDLAFDYFDAEVTRAELIWEREKERVRRAAPSAVGTEFPNPVPAQEILQRALDYWNKNEDKYGMIGFLDTEMANTVHQHAMTLRNELDTAKRE